MDFNRIVTDSAATPAQTRGRTRRYWTSDECATIVARWQASGLSQAEFCKEHNLSCKSLSRWHNKLRNPAAKKQSRKTPPVPSTVTHQSVSYVVSLPNGVTLRLVGQPEITLLLELLQQVATCKFD